METFAVAPGLPQVVIAVARNDKPIRDPDFQIYLIARIGRSRLRGTASSTSAGAERILDSVASPLVVRFRSGTSKLMPLRDPDAEGVLDLARKLNNWSGEMDD